MTDQWIESVRPSAFTETNIDYSMVGIRFGVLGRLRLKLQQDYEDTLVNPYIAAERGYVDAVIPPSHTRGYVATALRLLERKITQMPPKKHGNIPL